MRVCSDRIVSMKFMRKYIHVARDIRPVLTREAADVIANEYSKLRSQDNVSRDNIAKVTCHAPVLVTSHRRSHIFGFA